METLQYIPFHHVSFLPETLSCPHTNFPFNPLQSNNIFEFSSSSPPLSATTISSERNLSPVTDISKSLNGIKVSSPGVSPISNQQKNKNKNKNTNKKKLTPPSTPSSPPSPIVSPRLLALQKPPRARRNLSLSMDTFMNQKSASESSLPCIPSTLSPSLSSAFSPLLSDEILVSPYPSSSIPSIPLFEITEPKPTETSPQKSPKRCREEREREEAEQMQEFLLHAPQPLFRSVSLSLLGEGEKKQKTVRSLLMKSGSFVSRRDSCSPPLLPTTYGQHPDLQYVTPETVVDVIEGKYDGEIDERFVIDCRFPYEYEGGHINTAVNLTENEIKQMFIDAPRAGKKTVIIFHCEFSSQRAPRCLRFLRELDRKLNIAEYPKLSYPDVYVIEGGFKNFFLSFPNSCVGTYVEMRDERHFTEMKAHLRNFKRVRSMSADNTNIPFFQPGKFC